MSYKVALGKLFRKRVNYTVVDHTIFDYFIVIKSFGFIILDMTVCKVDDSRFAWSVGILRRTSSFYVPWLKWFHLQPTYKLP